MSRTLSSIQILTDTLKSFKKRVPMLSAMSTNFKPDPLRLGSTVMAHVRKLPTASTYDSVTGYANGATESRNLVDDVPVVIDQHQHVPIEIGYLNSISDQKDVYQEAIDDAAYVLAKTIVDSALAKVTAINFGYGFAEAAASVDRDTLGAARKLMNQNGAAAIGRVGIVNSDFYEALDADQRIASRDYYGQQTGGEAYGVLKNVAGFGSVYEYPDLPTNVISAGTFTAATTDICTKTAHGFLTGSRVRVSTSSALPAGLAVSTDYYVIKIDADTFKLASSRADAIAGTPVDITDTGTGTQTITGFENLSAFFFEPRAIALVTGIPDHAFEIAAKLGIPQAGKHYVVQDPETKLTLLGIEWQQPGTFNLFLTVVAVWGSSLGNQGGATSTLTDKAGLRVYTS